MNLLSSVQLFGEPSDLEELSDLVQGTGVPWISSMQKLGEAAVVVVVDDKSPLQHEVSRQLPWVFVSKQWTVDKISKLKEIYPVCFIVDREEPLAQQLQVMGKALQVAKLQLARQSSLSELRRQSQKIEALNTNLENIVHERTRTESDSRQMSKTALERVRDLVRFVKDLTHSVDLAGILTLVRREIKTFHGTSDPILYIPKMDRGGGQLIYFRTHQVSVKRLDEKWVSSQRIRINSIEESQFLADRLGRPIAQVISFPLPIPRTKSPEDAPVLFFEHNLSKTDIDSFISYIGERLQPVSLAIDRILLEEELRTASRVWEMTFDGLNEPIAILDMDNKLLRANAHFHQGLHSYVDNEGAFRWENHRYWLEKYAIRLKAHENPLSWVAYFRDETRSMKLKSQMVQVEKMSAIGQLAGHIAHELNNPLTGIRSMTQILLRESASDTQVHNDLQEVEKAATRCQSIINNLLEFSRGGLSEMTERLDLNELVKRTLPLLKSVLGRLESNIDLSEKTLMVKVEPHLMQQVIFNLVNNACQAIKGKGRVNVRTSIRQFDDKVEAWLEVIDTGRGIAPAIQELIFEPFFTTKQDGEGTGLGLSLSRDFIRQFGGELECESTEGEGALFRVRLPLEQP